MSALAREVEEWRRFVAELPVEVDALRAQDGLPPTYRPQVTPIRGGLNDDEGREG